MALQLLKATPGHYGDHFVTTLHCISRNKAPLEWSETHDVLLCREMLAVNPFKAKREMTQRRKMWETIVQHDSAYLSYRF